MKRVKLSFEYGCFPIWLYDEEGDLIDNELPEGLVEDEEIDSLCAALQQEFDGLFVDDGKEFRYAGFGNLEQSSRFAAGVSFLEALLRKRIGSQYEIVNTFRSERAGGPG